MGKIKKVGKAQTVWTDPFKGKLSGGRSAEEQEAYLDELENTSPFYSREGPLDIMSPTRQFDAFGNTIPGSEYGAPSDYHGYLIDRWGDDRGVRSAIDAQYADMQGHEDAIGLLRDRAEGRNLASEGLMDDAARRIESGIASQGKAGLYDPAAMRSAQYGRSSVAQDMAGLKALAMEQERRAAVEGYGAAMKNLVANATADKKMAQDFWGDQAANARNADIINNSLINTGLLDKRLVREDNLERANMQRVAFSVAEKARQDAVDREKAGTAAVAGTFLQGAGTVFGGLVGGPAGAVAGNQIGKTVGDGVSTASKGLTVPADDDEERRRERMRRLAGYAANWGGVADE